MLTERFQCLAEIPKAPGDPRQHTWRLQPEIFPRVIEVLRVLEEVAATYGRTPGQTALRWLLDQEGITSVIVGASSPVQVRENLGALGWRLEPIDWQRLSDVSWLLSAA